MAGSAVCVDDDSGECTGTLSGALRAATPQDVVLVNQGVYDQSFRITRPVNLLGGWDDSFLKRFVGRDSTGAVEAAFQGKLHAATYVGCRAESQTESVRLCNSQTDCQTITQEQYVCDPEGSFLLLLLLMFVLIVVVVVDFAWCVCCACGGGDNDLCLSREVTRRFFTASHRHSLRKTFHSKFVFIIEF